MDYRMPLYQQIKAAIQKKIENKEYLEGAAIPSERKLAEIYEVNRMTAKKAIDALVEEGYLYRVQGRGTFVHKENTQKIIWGNDALGLGAMLREKADTRRDKVLVKGLLKAFNFLGSKLDLAKYEDVYLLQRVRYANSEPFAVEYCYVPFKFFKDIDKHNFEHTSVYDYMKSKDHLPVEFNQKLIIIGAEERVAKQLQIAVGTPVYYFELISKDRYGNTVEYTETFVSCEKTVFSFYNEKRPTKKG
ncbi:GntR family transcriptional regulator [Enterococcus sp. DIV0187]|uniref:GntR family transcriptional regulator n=1 Tax=Enterococcus sp. DIV0187 TaxID=2774644 RepID=UPI003F219FBD